MDYFYHINENYTIGRFIVILFVVLGASSWAQKPAYVTYTMEEGLPSSTVYDIIQARDGAIWFATDNGVSRFDGYSFEYFGVNEGLPHPDVFALHEDETGKIWCGVMNNELCYIENGKIVKSKHAKNLSTFFKGTAIIQGIHVVGDELYLAYSYKGLIHIDSKGLVRRMDEEAEYQVFLTGKEENLLSKKEKKENSEITFSHKDYHLSIYDKNGLVERRTFSRPEFGGPIIIPKRTCYGHRDSLVILTGSHEALINRDNVEFEISIRGSNQIIRQDDRLWLGSQGRGLFLRENTQNGEFQVFSKGIFIPELLDDNGNVWVVETGVGVHCFKNIRIWNYEVNEELLEGIVTQISLSNDQLAVGYESGIIDIVSIQKDDKKVFVKAESYISGMHFFNNDLYVHTPAGFSRYDSSGRKVMFRFGRPMEPISPMFSCKRMLEYNKDVFSMVGTFGICLWDRNANSILFESDGMLRNRLQDQLIDHQKNIWGTSDKGIFRFDLETETLIPYVENISVSGIVELDNKDIWCSKATGGILLFDPKTKSVSRVELGEMVEKTFIKDLRKDKNGIVWGTSNVGLFRIDPKRQKVIVIQKSNGLLSNLLTDISISGDQLCVSSSKGVSLIDINESFKSISKPQLHINDIKLNGKSVKESRLTDLHYSENNIEVKFVAIGFETPGDYDFRYRLKGLSSKWQYTKELKAMFLSIPSGSYALEIEVYDPQGEWEVQKIIPLSIALPFWETWWFIFSVLLLVVIVTLLLYRRRIRKINQTNELKNEIKKFQQHAMTAQMNPHFIFNSMNSIQRFILENERLIANEYLVKFSGLMRLTLENSKKIWVPIDEELRALKLYLELETLRFKNKLQWEIVVSEGVDYSSEIPTLLIQPFVENSIWHGLMTKKEGGTVKIIIDSINGQFFCEVLDDGIGRDAALEKRSKEHSTAKSSGVSITKRRLELLHEESSTNFLFEIEDRIDNQGEIVGTRVYFSIPVIE